jgi:hypothetical protein
VQVRGWDANAGGGGVVRLHYYRLTIRRRILKRDIDKLIATAKRSRKAPVPQAAETPGSAFVLALGDLQLGKMDGDGVEGTVERFLNATAAAIKRYKRIAKGPRLPDPPRRLHRGLRLPRWRERLAHHAHHHRAGPPLPPLLLEQVKPRSPTSRPGRRRRHPRQPRRGAPAAAHLRRLVGHRGRQGAVRDATRVRRRLRARPLHAPERDELTVTLDIAAPSSGWRTVTSGVQVRRRHGGPSSHTDGSPSVTPTCCCPRTSTTSASSTPARQDVAAGARAESGSQWWKHRTGEWGQPGVVTALVGGGSWSALEVL